MKVIKPSVEIMDKLSPEEILKILKKLESDQEGVSDDWM